jgi:hypothetical protein
MFVSTAGRYWRTSGIRPSGMTATIAA